MEAYETLITRRSIRVYTGEKVPDVLVKQLLAAGMQAPSARNQRPWHFVAVTARETLNALAEVLPFGKMLTHAPLAIVVCADSTLEQMEGYWALDCAVASQNILLAAHAQGLGGVWLGTYPRQERVAGVSRVLGLPAHVTPVSVLSLGYPAEEVAPEDRYQESRVHYDRW